MVWRDEDEYFDSIFQEMEREFREMRKVMKSVLGGESSPAGFTEGPYYYGFSFTVGPDGKPQFREFGNIRPSLSAGEAGTREPLVDTVVDEKENLVRVVAEMLGVSKEDIEINATEDKITISAQRGNKKYFAEVPLPAAVDPSSSEATYNNGVLEVRLKLKKQSNQKGTSIKVN